MLILADQISIRKESGFLRIRPSEGKRWAMGIVVDQVVEAKRMRIVADQVRA